MPDDMSAGAIKQWDKVSKQLKEARIITNIDVDALSMYCEAYATWIDANKAIQKHGVVVKNKSGFPVQSPYFLVANKAFDQMRAMLTEFGMTPSSRTRVSSLKSKDEDEF